MLDYVMLHVCYLDAVTVKSGQQGDLLVSELSGSLDLDPESVTVTVNVSSCMSEPAEGCL